MDSLFPYCHNILDKVASINLVRKRGITIKTLFQPPPVSSHPIFSAIIVKHNTQCFGQVDQVASSILYQLQKYHLQIQIEFALPF